MKIPETAIIPGADKVTFEEATVLSAAKEDLTIVNMADGLGYEEMEQIEALKDERTTSTTSPTFKMEKMKNSFQFADMN